MARAFTPNVRIAEKSSRENLKSGWWKPLFKALQGVIAGFLIMLFSGIFSKEAGNAVVICIPIGLGIGLIIGLVGRMRVRGDAAKTSARNKPEFI